MKIPLERISYDELLKLSTEQRTQLFVKDKEIDRLNNIIKEFEKYLEETKGIYEEYTCAIKKLKELKGDDKE